MTQGNFHKYSSEFTCNVEFMKKYKKCWAVFFYIRAVFFYILDRYIFSNINCWSIAIVLANLLKYIVSLAQLDYEK
jgi:hypothetical protein